MLHFFPPASLLKTFQSRQDRNSQNYFSAPFVFWATDKFVFEQDTPLPVRLMGWYNHSLRKTPNQAVSSVPNSPCIWICCAIPKYWVNSIAALSGNALRKENEGRNSAFYLHFQHILQRQWKYFTESAFKFHNWIPYSPDKEIGNCYQTGKDGKLPQFKVLGENYFRKSYSTAW